MIRPFLSILLIITLCLFFPERFIKQFQKRLLRNQRRMLIGNIVDRDAAALLIQKHTLDQITDINGGRILILLGIIKIIQRRKDDGIKQAIRSRNTHRINLILLW